MEESGEASLTSRISAELHKGPSVAIAVPLVVSLTFVAMISVPSAGLDPSWVLGLAWARELGLVWGVDIAYTYGPWGLLNTIVPLNRWDLPIALLVWVALLALVAFAVWRLAAAHGRWIAFAVAFLVASQSTIGGYATTGLVAVVLLSLCVVFERVSGNAVLLGIGILAGASLLLKFNFGLTAICVSLLAGLATKSVLRSFTVSIAGVVIGLLGGWVLAGQPVQALGPYVSQSVVIAIGYRQGLGSSTDSNPVVGQVWPILGVVVIAIAIGLAIVATRNLGLRIRIIAVLIMAGTALSCYLASAIRLDPGHAPFLIAFVLTVLVPVMASLSMPRYPWLPITAAAVVFVGGVAAMTVISGTNWAAQTVRPWASVQQLISTIRTAITDEGRVESLERQREVLLAAHAIPAWELAVQLPTVEAMAPPSQAVIAALSGRKVQSEPWELGTVWANALTWHPVPVFQTHQAYSESLDVLNRDRLLDVAGPDGVLRQSAAIDSKNPLWEAPGYQLALLCNFIESTHDEFWQALVKVPNRCELPVRVSEQRVAAGERIAVPLEPGTLVVAKVSVADSEIDSLTPYPTVYCDDRAYRLAQGFPSGPLVVSAAASGWDERFLPPACQVVGASVDAVIEFETIPLR